MAVISSAATTLRRRITPWLTYIVTSTLADEKKEKTLCLRLLPAEAPLNSAAFLEDWDTLSVFLERSFFFHLIDSYYINVCANDKLHSVKYLNSEYHLALFFLYYKKRPVAYHFIVIPTLASVAND